MSVKSSINDIIVNYSASKGYQQDYVSFIAKGLLIVLLMTSIYSITFYAMGYYSGGLTTALTSVLLLGCILLFKTNLKISVIANTYLIICSFCLTYCIIRTGGITSPILPWLVCIPFFASLILKTIELWAWIAIVAFTISSLSYSYSNWTFENLIQNNSYLNLFYIVLNLGLLITLVILTYLSWENFYKNKRKKINKDVIYIDQSDINYFILNWNFIKSKLFEKFPKILETIDNLHFLTDHEKKYVLMKHFRLDVDLLADKLNVSKRTIETNLYRVNNKLKKNNINPDILLKNS